MWRYRQIVPAALAAWLLVYQVAAVAATEVTINNMREPEYTLEYADSVYLSDVLVRLHLDDAVCIGAASLVREVEKERQQRWKQSLLYDLQGLAHAAALENAPARREWFLGLYQMVAGQSVTGRLLGQNLNPYSVIPKSSKDRLLKHGDELNFPVCGTRLFYLNGRAGIVSYDPLRTLNDYAAELEEHYWQKAGYIWVVYPDGEFRKTKVGYWQHKREYAGSRAWLFRPVAAPWLKGINPNFNFELARWLATQVSVDE